MTRAASDCTSEHGKDYLDSRLMSVMAIYRQLTDIVKLADETSAARAAITVSLAAELWKHIN